MKVIPESVTVWLTQRPPTPVRHCRRRHRRRRSFGVILPRQVVVGYSRWDLRRPRPWRTVRPSRRSSRLNGPADPATATANGTASPCRRWCINSGPFWYWQIGLYTTRRFRGDRASCAVVNYWSLFNELQLSIITWSISVHSGHFGKSS